MTRESDNRVFSRTKARTIGTEEAEAVVGSFAIGFPGPHTNTACMFDPRLMATTKFKVTEDISEC